MINIREQYPVSETVKYLESNVWIDPYPCLHFLSSDPGVNQTFMYFAFYE